MGRLVILLLCVATGFAQEVKRATGSIIRTKGKIQTGSSSRLELELPFLAIVRIGSNAEFKFSPDKKQMSLDSGTMLLSMAVDTSGVSVESGSVVTAMSKGDLEMSNVGGAVKVITLNGKVRVSLAANPSDRRTLRAGQMVDVAVGATAMPPVTAIRLSTLLKTSVLFNMGPLPSSRAIRQNATQQTPPRPFVTGGFDPDWGGGNLVTIGPPGTAAMVRNMDQGVAATVLQELVAGAVPTASQMSAIEAAGKKLPPSNAQALRQNQGRPATQPGQTPRPFPTRPPVVTPPIATPRPQPTQGLPVPRPTLRPPIAVP